MSRFISFLAYFVLGLSIQTQHIHGNDYNYFYYYEGGKHRSLSLGRKGNPNVGNIYKAVEIVAEQRAKYESMHEQLLALLPQEERRRLLEAEKNVERRVSKVEPIGDESRQLAALRIIDEGIAALQRSKNLNEMNKTGVEIFGRQAWQALITKSLKKVDEAIEKKS